MGIRIEKPKEVEVALFSSVTLEHTDITDEKYDLPEGEKNSVRINPTSASMRSFPVIVWETGHGGFVGDQRVFPNEKISLGENVVAIGTD